MLNVYPWQIEQKQHLLKLQQQQRLAHALLLSGPEGIGLLKFTQAFALQMFCSKPIASGDACGSCKSCKLYLAGSHPDLLIIKPEEEGKQIKIEQIRSLIEYVALKSFSGNHKVIIIQSADAMNRATANALLKTLEEPPARSLFFLLSHRPEKLPITIRSRCQKISFSTSSNNVAINWLKQRLSKHEQQFETELSAESLLGLASGGPLKAIKILEEGRLQHRKAILNDLESLLLNQMDPDPIEIAANWQTYGNENVFINLLNLIQDVIYLKMKRQTSNLINVDLKKPLETITGLLDLSCLVKNYDFVFIKYQQSMLPMNYNILALFEEIILNWKKSK